MTSSHVWGEGGEGSSGIFTGNSTTVIALPPDKLLSVQVYQFHNADVGQGTIPLHLSNTLATIPTRNICQDLDKDLAKIYARSYYQESWKNQA